MRFTQQQQKGWLYTCTVEQRLAIFGVMHDWATEIGYEWQRDPLESRRHHRIFADRLAHLAREQHGVELQVDKDLRQQWWRLGPSTQARWIGMAGGWFEREDPGQESALVIKYALDPPSFRSQTPRQQQALLSQIAGEAERYMEEDPYWYGRAATPMYRQLVQSIKALDRPLDWWQPSPVEWSHVNYPERAKILADIAKCARMDSYRPRLQPEVREHLTDLAKAADWIADLSRPKVLIRE